MKSTYPIYTLGHWTVKPGKEDAFIALWRSFAQWTSQNQPGGGTGYLLQNPQQPQQFISFGPWESRERVDAWRARPEFQAFAVKVKDLCDRFEPQSLQVVATSEV